MQSKQAGPTKQAPLAGPESKTASPAGGASDPVEEKNVLLQTSTGDIELELYWNEAPKTCHNFFELSKRHYYDGVIFHRVIKDFMIQGGDPTGTGRGGQSIYGSPFEDECTPKLKHTGAGILSMANSGRNTNGSQFFLTCAPTPHLDGKHTIFGRVKRGMRVLQRISLVDTDRDRPVDPVSIYTARPCL